jgi:hypothetical protein
MANPFRTRGPIPFVLAGQSLSYSRANRFRTRGPMTKNLVIFLKVLCPKNSKQVKSIINANKDLLFEALRGHQQNVAYNPQ